MSELDVLRKDIDVIDERIADLLLSRFAVVKEIGAVKKRDGLPVTNSGREEEVIAKVRSYALDAAEKDAVEKAYRAIIQASKDLEK
ncbi:MAG TPA: chorismate mutase [Clostridiales bacterium]|nr:chorismate mutase [Clostridiales bacterium]